MRTTTASTPLSGALDLPYKDRAERHLHDRHRKDDRVPDVRADPVEDIEERPPDDGGQNLRQRVRDGPDAQILRGRLARGKHVDRKRPIDARVRSVADAKQHADPEKRMERWLKEH